MTASIPRPKAMGTFRCGSRISSATEPMLVHPSYGHRTEIIARPMTFTKSILNSAGLHGSSRETSAFPRIQAEE